MISVEIQEWQEMKAKLSQLQQELIIVRIQNQQLKNQLKLKKNGKKQNESSQQSFDPKIKVSSNQDSNYDEKNHFFQQNEQKSKQIQLHSQKHSKSQSSQYQGSLSNVNGSQDNDVVKLQMIGQRDGIEERQNCITVSRKSYKSTEFKNIITSKKCHDFEDRNQLPLIQDICVFGPNLQSLAEVTFKADDKQMVQPFLYYPTNCKDYQQYGSYLYPKKVRIKPTQRDHMAMQGNKILFKNSKKQECNIFIFQGIETHPIRKPNELLQKVNPSKWLYGIVMQFNDFVYKNEQKQNKQNNHHLSTSELNANQAQQEFSSVLGNKRRKSLLTLDIENIINEQHRMQTVSLKDIQFQKQKQKQHMYRSTFSLCIFTYFPFISYLQDIIYAIFDQVKLKRIQHFPKTARFQDCDIFYFINQLNDIISRIKQYFCLNPAIMRKQLSLKINQTFHTIDLNEENLYQQLYGKWAYGVIKKMDKDTFYQIYCMILLEQSVYFICEDQKVLTFIILLFSSMMTQPFSYPYPVISVIFSQQLLQTPFTSIIGINQSEKWLQQAIQYKIIDTQNKHIVIIGDKQVKIRRQFKYNVPKSDMLRKIFANFYKKSEPSSLTTILLRKDTLCLDNLKQQNECLINFFVKIQLFYHQNIFSYMPNKMKIMKLGGEMTKSQTEINRAQIRNDLLDKIQEYYKKSNPGYFKDQFLKEFVNTQIFSICLMEEYQLNQG